MLHIFLFILKLIGWVLLLILGLLLLVIVAALFTPLRYHVETRCQGKLSTLEAGINFRILFRLISGSIQYRMEIWPGISGQPGSGWGVRRMPKIWKKL